MSIEIKPVGDVCNLSCSYCYEHKLRTSRYPLNIDRMKEALTKYNGCFTIFGGEPLLTPIDVLEEFFKFGFEKFKQNSIQTNASLITPAHLDLFKKYNVHVGISVDGPGELNSARCNRNITNQIFHNIDFLIGNGIIPSFIITISKANTGEHLHELIDWFYWLDAHHVRATRLHNLEDNGKCSHLLLTDLEQYLTYTAIYQKVRNLEFLKFDIFEDIQKAFSGKGGLTCIWNGCDSYNTQAVQGIRANGESENCGRIYKDGIIWLKSDTRDNVRQHILWNTPQSDGGCKDCKFFGICGGQCPGTAIDFDWRNRTRDCEFWKMMFNYFLPTGWTPKEVCNQEGNSYANVPHGDSHGDHTDASRIVVPVIS